ncbi:DUF881 domain-containing protein [Serinibacter salmoneus]|uniref:Uncharacterized protein YlxW (UPF0749 family) n=1 Tax=Serinibacter salmoneus TaxID=556530 RepID=A0A2A9D5H2_9MICO|nr:DUF881 domain-containing protein [Serinibacter salmoneus]PFG21110.1 uncharacterized protein YlxW (UPF0749 family) [Serinibacter salmoneus]
MPQESDTEEARGPDAPDRRRPSFAVAGVALLAGMLFATSATVFAQEDDDRAGNLRDLVAEENERLLDLGVEVEELRADVARLEGDAPESSVGADEKELFAVGAEPVAGQGVRVTLTDAPAGTAADDYNDLVVHQQDIQAVVNALWRGGAEAMSIQGQRVVSTTAVRCIGNVLLLHEATYSPPYYIEAIGDQEALEEALAQDASIRLYQEYVERFGLGYAVERDDLTLAAYTGGRSLSYATPLEASA